MTIVCKNQDQRTLITGNEPVTRCVSSWLNFNSVSAIKEDPCVTDLCVTDVCVTDLLHMRKYKTVEHGIYAFTTRVV